MRVLTVCSLPDILGSSKSLPALAKGETAAILAVVVVVCLKQPGRGRVRIGSRKPIRALEPLTSPNNSYN